MKRTLALGLVVAALVAPAVLADEDKPKAEPKDRAANAEAAKAAVSEIVETLKAADAKHKAKEYADALAKHDEAFAKLEKAPIPERLKKNLEVRIRYNQACEQALLGKKADAVQSLERAVALGYEDWKHLEEDPELASVRDDEAVKKLLAEGRAALPNEVKKALAGEPLFDLKLDVKTIDGKQLKLEDLKGKVVIVDFWGTWCPPCRNEIPHFVKAYETYKDKGLEIVGLASERAKTQEDAVKLVKEFAEKAGIKYPLAAIGHEDPSIKSVPGFNAYPTTLYLDRTGKVRMKRVGYEPYEKIEAIVKVLLDTTAAPESK